MKLNRALKKVMLITVVNMISVFIISIPNANADTHDLALSWYGGYNYTDNQTITGEKRIIVDAPGLRGRYNYGFIRWCITANGQPLKTREYKSYGIRAVYSYYALNYATRGITQSASAGCWDAASTDLIDTMSGFDIQFDTSSWSDGIYSIVITGTHKNGSQVSKSLTISTINNTSSPKISASTGATISGKAKMTLSYSRMNAAGVVCLKRNGSPVDSSIDISGVPPDASGCWTREVEAGAAKSIEFAVNTLAWSDGNYLVEATIPHEYPEVGTASATFSTVNPTLGLSVSGVTENENVSGLRSISVGAVVGSVHTSQITPSKYCVDVDGQACTLTTSTSNPSATFKFVSQLYPDGAHSLKIRVIDSAGREASKTVVLQIVNGKPVVSGAKVSTTKPAGANGLASALISFSAPKSSAATVEIRSGKANVVSVDVDLTSSTDGLSSVNFENLQPSTKFTYRVSSRNANGESKTVTGKFTTPAAPKKVSRGGGSGQSSGSGYGISVIGWRLDRALAALGWSRSQATEASSCSNSTWLGIINLDNWIVVGQTSSMLYACKR